VGIPARLKAKAGCTINCIYCFLGTLLNRKGLCSVVWLDDGVNDEVEMMFKKHVVFCLEVYKYFHRVTERTYEKS
jgi:DNA repair photolyase